MRIRIFTSLMLAGMLSLSSCVNDGDIDDLQSQIDELNSTVQNLKQSQQADLLAGIANLTSDLSALDNKIQSDLDNLQTNLGSLGLNGLKMEVVNGQYTSVKMNNWIAIQLENKNKNQITF